MSDQNQRLDASLKLTLVSNDGSENTPCHFAGVYDRFPWKETKGSVCFIQPLLQWYFFDGNTWHNVKFMGDHVVKK